MVENAAQRKASRDQKAVFITSFKSNAMSELTIYTYMICHQIYQSIKGKDFTNQCTISDIYFKNR